MTQFNIELKGFAELERKLGKPIAPKISAFIFAVGELVRAAIAKAPGPSHSPVIWASERQRRWYFAARAAGDKSSGLMGGIRRGLKGVGILARQEALSPQYKRETDSWSQASVKSWATAHRGSMDAVVGNKADYSARVQGADKQTAQHKATGWITDKMAMAKVQASGKIKRMWKDFVENLLK